MRNTAKPKTIPCTDEVLLETWRAKDELSASYGHNINCLFDDLRRREKRSGHRVVNMQKSKPAIAARKPKRSGSLVKSH